MSRTLILGGGSGIGRAIQQALYPTSSTHTPTQEMIDVTEPSSIAKCLHDQGRFDHVVFSVGIQTIEKLGDVHHASSIVETNLVGFINVVNELAYTQPLYPTSIVAIVSDASRVAMRGSIAYCASKAGLAHAVRCAAREMAPAWRVNGVSPGVVDDTPMTNYIDAAVPKIRGWTTEQTREYERSMIPMGRRATKEEVADLVLSVLYGPEYLTGAIIEMTGGK